MHVLINISVKNLLAPGAYLPSGAATAISSIMQMRNGISYVSSIDTDAVMGMFQLQLSPGICFCYS